MQWNTVSRALIPLAAVVIAGCAGMAAQPAGSVYFIEPADGATVTSPFIAKFAVVGMDLKPAGDEAPNSGHHHVLVNLDAMPAGATVPFDATHLHFGKAQTEAEIKLPPGTYKLTMQFADKDHKSYGPGMAKSTTVTVK
jgi:hypothetical protein